ncbi:hypothetical protein RSOL_364780 [Rhizoctonia solani AG-3 Rhs1AP]|uniref:Uncharacterized protein n=2 Tax=Rhizoctonia solani AG-3 TaxID=1086053 RepID=A0A074REM6_9AGAM|nr:hypothetical protein RSOL_364780 [Rhizoctonia solani AG-3 Rhs1AP]KEP45586.1 hypothetical protein V565_257930 [Rhizoctonia solani 123E]
MLLPVSAQFSGSNYSSMLSNKRDPTAKCRLRFSKVFLDPTDDISKWHDQQQSTRFHTIQYRKERTGVGHEFILLLLQRERGSDVDCYCRVERVGDPEHLTQVIYIDGTIAEDYIQAIPLSDPSSASLTHNSDVVVEITFPQTFMLRDVLAICCGISNHFRARRYTLQQYNCYFFSWTVILALARACMNWESSPSITEHVNNIRDRMMQSIYEQGPTRFHSVAYIVSNNTLDSHGNEGHPLDRAIRSRLCSVGFTHSICTALQDVLWTNRLPVRLMMSIKEDLAILARESIDLITLEQVGNIAIDIVTTQDKRDLDFEHAIHKVTQQAGLVCVQTIIKGFPQLLAAASPIFVLLKQRVGHEVWCKELAKCCRHPSRIFDVLEDNISSSESWSTSPRGQQPTSSSMRDLCFRPPSAILGFSARLTFTIMSTIAICFVGACIGLKDHKAPKQNVFQRVALCGKTIFRSAGLGIWAIPRNFHASKHLLLFTVGVQAAQRLGPAGYEHLGQLSAFDELDLLIIKSRDQVLEVFNTGLRELLDDKGEYQPSILRRCVASGVSTVLRGEHEEVWITILQQCLLEKLAWTTRTQLEGLVEQAHVEHVFKVIRKHGSGLSQAGIPNLGSQGSDIQPIKISNVALPSQACSVANPNPNSWFYQDLQHFIRQRISQLSNRETEFAPYLKHMPFAKEAKVCQNEIEVAMEEIWEVSQPLIGAQPNKV